MSDAEIEALADDDYDEFEDAACQTCDGEGFEDCNDVNSAEGCWEADCNDRFHTCPNCRGSGNAIDQRFW